MNKRTKSRNFTTEELFRLLNLIEKTPALTCKKTDAITNASKEAAWSEMADKFNAENGSIHRDVSQLKLKWDNLKKAAKKRATIINSNNRATGGGERPAIIPDPILDKIISIIKLITCVGPRSFFDDDAGQVVLEFSDDRGLVLDAEVESETQQKIQIQSIQVDEGPQTSNDDKKTTRAEVAAVVGGNKWDCWNPTILKTPVNPKLKLSKRKSLQDEVMISKVRKNNAIAKYYEEKSKRLPTIPHNHLGRVPSPPVACDVISDLEDH